MNKNIVICPACGSDAVTVRKVEKEISLPYGGKTKLSVDEYLCSICGMEGDFTSANDKIISEAYDKANLAAVNNIIDEFVHHKISMAAMERALDLPQRTLTKWKNGLSHPSATGIALMKMAGTFPWLLEVAENNYEPMMSKKIFIKNAVDTLMDLTVTLRASMNLNAGEAIQASGAILYYKIETIDEHTPMQIPQFPQIGSSAISSIAHVAYK